MARSLDGGATFGAQVLIAQSPNVNSAPGTFNETCGGKPFVNGFITLNFLGVSLATDPLNSDFVYVVWHSYEESTGSMEVFFSRSLDAGQNWGPRVLINSNTARDQFFPEIATGTITLQPQGMRTLIEVIWYDRRLDPSNLQLHVFSDASVDGGATWGSDTRWTTAPSLTFSDSPNPDCLAGLCYFGDYIGLAPVAPPGSASFAGGWGDTRLPMKSGPSCSNPSFTITMPDPNVMTGVGC